jgi:hypothetical protein
MEHVAEVLGFCEANAEWSAALEFLTKGSADGVG